MLRTTKPTTKPIATAPPVFNPPEREGELFVPLLPVPSIVGLAVGFSVGIEGSDTVGLPVTVSLVGGRGKEAGGEEPEGTEGVDGSTDGGGTLVEGIDGNVDGGGTTMEGGGGD